VYSYFSSASDATLKGIHIEPTGIMIPDFHRLELNYAVHLGNLKALLPAFFLHMLT
jgi:hypothetical protein